MIRVLIFEAQDLSDVHSEMLSWVKTIGIDALYMYELQASAMLRHLHRDGELFAHLRQNAPESN